MTIRHAHVELDLHADEQQITGTLRHAGRRRPFRGWFELTALLEAALQSTRDPNRPVPADGIASESKTRVSP